MATKITENALAKPFVPAQSAEQGPNIATEITQIALAKPFVPPKVPNKGPAQLPKSPKMRWHNPTLAQHWPQSESHTGIFAHPH